MTQQEILAFLNDESNSGGLEKAVATIYLSNGDILTGKFAKKYQPLDSVDENQWVVYSIDNYIEPVEIDGNDVKKLEHISYDKAGILN